MMNLSKNIKFLKVTGSESQIAILYKLLKNRVFYISHQNIFQISKLIEYL